MSEVEFHICCCPSVRTTRLDKLGERREGKKRYITASASLKKKGKIHTNKNNEQKKNLIGTFSTRSMKKSLTSFVLVNFAAMFTRPLERFCNQKDAVTGEKSSSSLLFLAFFVAVDFLL